MNEYPNPDYFHVREENGLRLIIPAHGAAVGNAAWSRENIWWRSRVEALGGVLVSQGFGKFFNLGQGPVCLNVDLKEVARAITHEKVYATLKLDGSLLIRSVYEGKVYLRTRGSFSYEHLENAWEIDEFRKKYPRLFDPSVYPNSSLLLEWVSPNNQIVIKYPEPALTVIGMVHHSSLRYARVVELKEVAEVFGIPMVHFFPLTPKGWEELYLSLDANKEIEGYVIRIDDEQTLVKVKCAPYITKHALKSHLTTEKLADMYFQYGRPDFSSFIQSFGESFDEETAMWAMPAIASLYDGVRELNKIETHVIKKSEAARAKTEVHVQNGHKWEEEAIRRQERKDFAITSQNEYGKTKKFALAMNIYLRENSKNNDYLKSILLQNTKQTEMSFLKPGTDMEG